MGRLSATAIALVAAFGIRAASATPVDHSEDAPSPNWDKVHHGIFADRPFEADSADVIALDVPARAEDAAVVPLAVRITPPQSAQHFIKKVYLVIDNNPSPMGAVFTFTTDSGKADIETRVRIEGYTHVRAIAESSDGKLYMADHYVKAAGGCSAPAGKDAAEAMARLGKMRLRTEGDLQVDQPNLAQLMISHPNNSGMVMDQLTRAYTPARFVRTVQVSYAGQPVMSAELDFTISENPNFRFYFVPHGAGDLKAVVVDSDNADFQTSVALRPGAPGSAATQAAAGTPPG